MKVLKLYGEKDDFSDFVADIYVKDNKVVVESEYKKLREEILDRINQAIDKGEGYTFTLRRCVHDKESIKYCEFSYKVGDEEFLEALRNKFWNIGEDGFGDREYDGYKIFGNWSKIIEKSSYENNLN